MNKFNEFFINNHFKAAVKYYASKLNFDQYGYHLDLEIEERLEYFYAWCRFNLLLGKAKLASGVFDKIIPIDTDISKATHPSRIARLFDQRANIAFYMGDYDQAHSYIKKALAWKESIGVRANINSSLRQSYIIEGKILWKQGALFKALEAYFKTFKYNIKIRGNPDLYNGRVWCLIGQVYLDLGNPQFALRLFEFSHTLLKQSLLVDNHLYIGIAAINKAKSILRLLKTELQQAEAKGSIYDKNQATEKIGTVELFLAEAKNNFEFSISKPYSHRYYGTLMAAYALLEELKLKFKHIFPDSELDKVLFYYDQERKYRRSTFEQDHPTLTISYNNSARAILSEEELNEENLRKALQFAKKAEKQLLNIQIKPRMFETYYLLAKIYQEQFRCSGKYESLNMAYQAIRNALSVGQEIYSENRKFTLTYIYSLRIRQAHELALSILHHIWDYKGNAALNGEIANIILSIMEGSRAVNHYFYNMLGGKAPLTNFPGFNIIQESLEKLMEFKLNDLSILRTKYKEKVHEALDQVVGQIAQIEGMLSEEDKSMNAQYPDSIGANSISRNRASSVEIDELCAQFNDLERGAILSYIITDKTVFITILSSEKGKFDFFRIGSEKDVKKLNFAASGIKRIFNEKAEKRIEAIPSIKQLIKHLEAGSIRYDDKEVHFLHRKEKLSINEQLFIYSVELYRFLFQGVYSHLKLYGVERLYIIRDNAIHFLPFEFLAPQPTFLEYELADFGFKNLNYLIKNFKISYHLSISLLYHRHEKLGGNFHQERLGSHALSLVTNYIPYRGGIEYRDTQGLIELQFALEQLSKVVSPIELKRIENEAINWSVFKSHLENPAYYIVQLLLHTSSLDNPKMDFGLLIPENKNKVGVLRAKHIRQFDLSHIQLLLFNACRGGEGEQVSTKYEIPDSLVNAFIMDAKVRNALFSSFKTSPLEAGLIMEFFLRNLRLGMNFVTALQHAKIDLINGKNTSFNNPLKLAHPFFWAKHIFIGNQQARLNTAFLN